MPTKLLRFYTSPPVTLKYLNYFMLLCFVFLSGVVTYYSADVPATGRIERRGGYETVIQQLHQGTVVQTAIIRIETENMQAALLAPRINEIDPLYGLLLFVCSIVVLIFFRDFSYRQPFTRKALTGLRVFFWLFLVFMVVNQLRYRWFDSKVEVMTNHQYSFIVPSPFALPELWIAFILLRGVWMFRKAVELQTDINYTV